MLTLSPTKPLRAVTGIQITLLPEGSWVAAYCGLRRSGAAVSVQGLASGLVSLAALRAALPESPTPVALVLTGRGILYRNLPAGQTPAIAPAEKIAAALPGAAVTDFYAQQCLVRPATGEEYERLSLVRKEIVDALLTELHQAGLWVVDLSLGPERMAVLLPYLLEHIGQSAIQVADFQLSADTSGVVTDFIVRSPDEPLPPPLQIGADTIAPEAVLSYAAALSCLLPGTDVEIGQLNVPAVAQGRSEWWNFQLYQVLRLGLPSLLLVVLVINFLLSQRFSTDQEDLTVDLTQSKAVLTRLKSLQQSVAQKQAFLSATGWAQPSWNSLCADRLAATVPPGVHLLSLEVSPPRATQSSSGTAASRNPTFRNGVVLVKGQCQDAQHLNIWLQKVSALRWVRTVRDQNFAYDYANNVGTFTFALDISPPPLFL